MKILICVGNWAPAIGGVETVTMDLARGLAARSGSSGEAIGVVVATRTPAGQMNDASLPFRVVRRPGMAKMWRLMRDADIVHFAGPMLAPLLLGVLARRPLVLEHHGFQAICPNGQLLHEPSGSPCQGYFMAGRHGECLRCNAALGTFRSVRMWLLTWLRRWLCRRTNANIAPTAWLAGLLRLPHTRTVWHGLPLAAPPPGEPSADGVLAFAFLGRLVDAKGAHLLLRAACDLKAEGLRFRLKIIGDGPERGRLEGFARVHGLEGVEFLGRLPGEAVEQELLEVSAILMPSLGGEVFGLVALENMMRGKLVIVSDIGALAEVVGDAGLVCPAGDVDAWAGRMREAIRNPTSCKELGDRARKRALALFSLDHMIAGHIRVYRDAMAHAK